MIVGADGKLKSDPTALAKMTDEDAENFFSELEKGTEVASSGTTFKKLSGSLQKGFQKTQDNINGQEGESSSEKLSAFIKSKDK